MKDQVRKIYNEAMTSAKKRKAFREQKARDAYVAVMQKSDAEYLSDVRIIKQAKHNARLKQGPVQS